MSRTKRITLGVAAGALALGAGLGATGMASAATTPTPSASASASADSTAPGDGMGGGHKGDRGQIAADLASKLGVEEAKVTAHAQREVDAAVKRLTAAGWKARGAVRSGGPLHELLDAVESTGAHGLVIGARGTGGVERLLLGSVAESAVHNARFPVLVVR